MRARHFENPELLNTNSISMSALADNALKEIPGIPNLSVENIESKKTLN